MRALLSSLVLLAACQADDPRLRHRPDVATSTSDPSTSATTSTATTTTGGSTSSTTPTDPGPSDYELCFQDIATDPSEPAPDYDQFGIEVGSHCSGTDHQDISGIERVVFLGDSVTVGTPPTAASRWFRNQLADELADRFGLQRPGWLWKNVDIFEGTTWVRESGDFASCAKWGARADDLYQDNDQLLDCFPTDQRDKTTLVVMTVGGNDLQSLQEGFQDGLDHATLWSEVDRTTALYREAMEWITEPGRFPNGVHVVTTNLYEYTDATGDVTSCPGAALAGYQPIEDPELTLMVIEMMEQYASTAVDTGTDMAFLLEHFCGHGYRRNDATGRCYRGPDAELWFDISCIHPNGAGHDAITDIFLDIVDE